MTFARWFPNPIWKGVSCYIVGGGPSLKDFDWNRIRGKNVIGCNVAFYMGADLIPYTVFGDAKFLKQHLEGLEDYVQEGGVVVTNSSRLRKPLPPTWLKVVRKQLHGLGTDCLAWNGNTGSSAINLALLFGASPVYLLGYDMQLSQDGKGNYHNAYSNTPSHVQYKRFLKGMDVVSKDLKKLFPGKQVINLEDGTSALEVFPKESLKHHFIERVAV